MKLQRLILCLAVICAASIVNAQISTGLSTYATYGGGPESINLGNLNSHWTVPVLHKAGRGVNFIYDLSYDSSIWTPIPSGSSKVWQPTANFGWTNGTTNGSGYVTYNTDFEPCPDGSVTTYSGWSYVDAWGATHPFSPHSALIIVVQDPLHQCNATAKNSFGPVAASDGSGYTLSATANSTSPPIAMVVNRSGVNVSVGTVTSTPIVTDTNGNQISVVGNTFTDTLGTTALTVSGSSPITYSYPKPGGTNGQTASVTVNFKSYIVKTNFGCSGINEYGPTTLNLVDNISFPDGSKYVFQYEPTPGFGGDVTGRVASVQLPTGGQVQYFYTFAQNGSIPGNSTAINCSDGTAIGLRRTTPDGTSTYIRSGSGTTWTTNAYDPQSNQTILSFVTDTRHNFYETLRQIYQGLGPSTPLKTVSTCYNASCSATSVTPPITSRVVQNQLPNSAGRVSEADYTYNTSGLVTEVDDYDFGAGAKGALLRKTIIAYATLSGILDRPSSVTVQDGSGTQVAQTTYSYDGTTPTATSGTPQHVAPPAARGNSTSVSRWVSTAAGSLTSTYAYFDTGMVKSITDPNTSTTNFTYGDCGNSFVTSVALPLSLSTGAGWDCEGGVMTSSTDANGQSTQYQYSDGEFWRQTAIIDSLNNSTGITYTPNTTESTLSFNSGNSVVDLLTTFDSMGRQKFSQVRQAPGSGTFDSIQHSFDPLGRLSSTTLPYNGTAGQSAPPSVGVANATFDALSRPVTQTDSGGGSTTWSYPQNDMLVSVGPAPSGESTKQRQLEYDGLGRVSSVCELTSAANGGGNCTQTTTRTGYWTRYTYDPLGNIKTVLQNAQSGSTQSRSFTYDGLGRLLSEVNPETGTTTYTYDSDSSCGSSKGDLVKRIDNMGNVTCYSYDALHRVISVVYSGPYASVTPTKNFVYDVSTVNGVAMANGKGRLVEAFTGPLTSKITDLGYSYTVRGEVSDIYESTPNSGGYFHTAKIYWPHGALKQLTIPRLPTLTYNVDSEGRTSTVSASSGQNPVTSTTYNAAGRVTDLTIGSGDSDHYTFDSNTGRMTEYKFTVGAPPQNVIGNITWNPNGSMASLGITDPLNASNTQNCTFAHDDLGRVATADCGSVWSQSFGFDPFGNITKNGSITFTPTYSTTTNRFTALPGVTPTYDSNGNVTYDGFHSYQWDAEGKQIINDGSGNTDINDAFGRLAESSIPSASFVLQNIYDESGNLLAQMQPNGHTWTDLRLPGGARVNFDGTSVVFYRHADWLGSARFGSKPDQTFYSSMAYAPYGEVYAKSGSFNMFAGMDQHRGSDMYDTPYREYHVTQGRWLTPDPGGACRGGSDESTELEPVHICSERSFGLY